MKPLRKRLKELSSKFIIKNDGNEFSLWYGGDHRILIWEKNELSDDEIVRLAKDFLDREPWLKEH